MKPTISDKNLRDAVLKELEDDQEVVAKHTFLVQVDLLLVERAGGMEPFYGSVKICRRVFAGI